MNILFISNYYPKQNLPHCIFIHQQAKALALLGHHVEVIVPSYDIRYPKKIMTIQYEDIPVTYYSFLQLYKNIYCSLINIINIRHLEKTIDFSQYDVISFHMFDEYVLRIFMSIAKKHQLVTVVHYHGLTVLYDYILPLYVRLLMHRGNLVLKKYLLKADAFVGVSDKVCTNIRKEFGKQPIFTVYNGTDTRLFQPSIRTRGKDFFIITVASLKKIKGNHYLIEAVKKLKNIYKECNIQLIIIGRGPEEAALKAQVISEQLEQLVHFAGFIPNDKVAEIMQRGDVFAMPSYYEALGCSYLDAMACRLPVIGCYMQGIDEIITNGYNGFLIEPHNVSQLFEKLEVLLLDPVRAENIAENGYRTVLNGYTWLDSAKNLLEVYQKLI